MGSRAVIMQVLVIFLMTAVFYPASAAVRLVEAVTGLNQPTFVASPPRDRRLFVTEKTGRIWMVQPGGRKSVFLDISSKVSTDGERGLLSIAFDPSFRRSRLFFIYYNDRSGADTVWRYLASPGAAGRANANSARRILSVPKQFSNHNGGQLAFGPDGYLYIGLGDGGGAGDPGYNAQNLGSLLGKVLRVKVSGQGRYRIPRDNPFRGTPGARKEIFAYGFRNPWRFSFDNSSLWLADVGQSRFEEIDLVMPGGNYGWPVLEAAACYRPETGCDPTGKNPPVHQYGRSVGGSVTGGYVYRGKSAPSLVGAYIFGDFLSGNIWALRLDVNGNAQVSTVLESGLAISSFGIDRNRDLYVIDFGGRILKVEEG